MYCALDDRTGITQCVTYKWEKKKQQNRYFIDCATHKHIATRQHNILDGDEFHQSRAEPVSLRCSSFSYFDVLLFWWFNDSGFATGFKGMYIQMKSFSLVHSAVHTHKPTYEFRPLDIERFFLLVTQCTIMLGESFRCSKPFSIDVRQFCTASKYYHLP